MSKSAASNWQSPPSKPRRDRCGDVRPGIHRRLHTPGGGIRSPRVPWYASTTDTGRPSQVRCARSQTARTAHSSLGAPAQNRDAMASVVDRLVALRAIRHASSVAFGAVAACRSARCLPSWKRAGTTAVRRLAPHTSSGGPCPSGSPRPGHVLTAIGETTVGLRHLPPDPLLSLPAGPRVRARTRGGSGR